MSFFDLTEINKYAEQLNSFDETERAGAISTLHKALLDNPDLAKEPQGIVNLHYHTFHSFNCENYSPSRIIWECKRRGIDIAGIVDFDVLHAMAEVMVAARFFNQPAICSLETRVYDREFSQDVLNSPGEPAVSYYMGVGFVHHGEQPHHETDNTDYYPSAAAEQTLVNLQKNAEQRNRALLTRIAPALTPLKIDYDRDVLPLTPSGNATERHILQAIDQAAKMVFPDQEKRCEFFADILQQPVTQVTIFIDNPAKLTNLVRAKLMKSGGIGYVKPTPDTFPAIETVTAMIKEFHALPCLTWLDGTSSGESQIDRLFDRYLGLGCLAANIIPDRNWNIQDQEVKAIKVQKFHEFVNNCIKHNLVILVGTEMNNHGLPFVDEFDAPEMLPYKKVFVDNAYALYAHSLLEKSLRKGLGSDWAKKQFNGDRSKINEFYCVVGHKATHIASVIDLLRAKTSLLCDNISPEQLLQFFS